MVRLTMRYQPLPRSTSCHCRLVLPSQVHCLRLAPHATLPPLSSTRPVVTLRDPHVPRRLRLLRLSDDAVGAAGQPRQLDGVALGLGDGDGAAAGGVGDRERPGEEPAAHLDGAVAVEADRGPRRAARRPTSRPRCSRRARAAPAPARSARPTAGRAGRAARRCGSAAASRRCRRWRRSCRRSGTAGAGRTCSARAGRSSPGRRIRSCARVPSSMPRPVVDLPGERPAGAVVAAQLQGPAGGRVESWACRAW